MPSYVKFLKDILIKKRKLEDFERVALTKECSALIQNKLPPKLKDPRSFSIPYIVGGFKFTKALCDLGASVSIMPLSIAKKLGLNEIQPTTVSLQLADRTIKYPIGIIKDVLVKVGHLYISVDFIVLEMEEDLEIPLILGQPFLATAGIIIDLEIVDYTDSDFAGCQDDMKSTSGYIFMLAEGAVSWKSVKQKFLTSSTMQAEFVTCYGAATQAIWLKNLISRLCVVDSISRPLKIYNDNRSVVLFTKNNKSTSGSKHLEIKYLKVRDFVKNADIVVEHIDIDTDNMLVDPLTKGLRPTVFSRHVESMGILGSLDVLD
ncbi:PREDICTED: uncharacterized protein LOC108661411 [Theobroma cacao]|uniref:Uncharacterized protein LOC108661411 n=1 Tax=Theobroma cacao TaxID=3641 RepID=A0AB32W672_THECC|nr:PREDICTED: uncharacterized protein LOC108661411 [Theobroma cacao]